jgi:putative component of toxin-antitoxin plasmid stabilization module
MSNTSVEATIGGALGGFVSRASSKDTVVIILCGGDKGSQERNITKAKEYWQAYKNSLKKT